jgi:hypothetical protein
LIVGAQVKTGDSYFRSPATPMTESSKAGGIGIAGAPMSTPGPPTRSSATLGKNLEFYDGELGLTVGTRKDMVDRPLFGVFWILDSTVGLLLDRVG